MRKLNKDKDVLKRHDKVIRQYLIDGHAEIAPDVADGTDLYYMPHRVIIKDDSTTTKSRIVFDASSSVSGHLSLNECLEKGVNINPELLELILKFQIHKVGFTADIQKAFLKVQI